MSRQHAAAALLFGLLSVAMTWPLARNIAGAVAFPGDPYINTWILDWDVWAILHRVPLFDANIFYPTKGTLALSENLLGIAVFLIPLRLAGLSAIAAYNVAMLAGFAFSGFAAYLLGMQVSRSWWASVAAGIFYAFVPFRFVHISHVQHVWGGWLPLLLCALLAYGERPTWLRASLFGAVFLMNGLTNIHWLVFGTIAIALTSFLVVRRWLPFLIATAVAATLLLPILLPYKHSGFRRGTEEMARYSATPRDWTTPHSKEDPERHVWPGFVALALSLAALTQRRSVALSAGVLWILLGFLGSLGVHTPLWRLGFGAIRAPARWAAITYVGMAVLIALAPRRRAWIAVLATAVLLFELNVAPIRWYLLSPDTPPVYQWLAKSNARAVLELPIDLPPASEYTYMIHATAHHKPIVNGVSGFAPPSFTRVASLGTSDALIPELQRLGVDTIIVHGNTLGDRDAATRAWLRRELEAGRLEFVNRFDGNDWVFRNGGQASLPVRAGGTGSIACPPLESFLRGEPTYESSTFGILDFPRPGEVVHQKAFFSGWALSPYGIRDVELRFNNGAVRVKALLMDDKSVSSRYPWYPATPKPRFVSGFEKRPEKVWKDTDVQVAITDGRGKTTLFESRWFTWE